jgi:antitoxin component YwqK of YwqJK toxin-antitoxin module
MDRDCKFWDNSAQKEGLRQLFHKNGNVKQELNYKGDKLEDIGKVYYESGNLMEY